MQADVKPFDQTSALLQHAQTLASAMGDEEQGVAAFSAFFDESGKLSDSEYVVFAGCFNDEKGWEPFARQWRRRLRQARVLTFSMKDAMNYREEFKSWRGSREKERDQLVVDLAEIAFPQVQFTVSAYVNTAEFKALPRDITKSLRNPQYACFEACIRGIVEEMLSFENDRLQVVCDSSEEYSRQCLELYLQMRARNAGVKKHCSSIAFAEDQDFPGLQLADMLAYCHRQQHTADGGTSHPVTVEVLRIFSKKEGGRKRYLRYSPLAGLGKGVLEDMHMQELRSLNPTLARPMS